MGKLNIRNRNLNQFDKTGKLKAPNWEYRFEAARIKGKRQSISKAGFKTKKEAIEAGTKAMSEYNESGLAFRPSEMSVADYLDYWLEHYCKVNLKETTVQNYTKKINLYIKPAIGGYFLKSIQPAAIQTFLDQMFNDGFSRNTLTCIRGILTGSFNYAVEPLEFIKFNPALSVRLPLQRAKPAVPSRKKTKRPVTDEEWRQIIARFPEGEPAHIPLVLAYRCGFRMGEAFGLMWDDVDFEESTITVQRQVQRVGTADHWSFCPPKYDSYRTVNVDADTMALLRREKDRQDRAREFYSEYHIGLYAADVDESEHLIDSGYLTTVSTNNKVVNMIMQRESGEYIQPRIMQHVGRIVHGVYKDGYPVISADWDYHSLRITHASKLRERGVPETIIQERLGHADIEVTERYIKPTEKMRSELKDQLNSMFES